MASSFLPVSGTSFRDRRRRAPRDVALSLNNLAFLLVEKGDYAGAEPLYRRARAMGLCATRRRCRRAGKLGHECARMSSYYSSSKNG